MSIATKNRISKEGSVEPLGVGGSITGRHYDKVFVDDIVTLRDRVSRAERESTKTFIKELKNIPTDDGNVVYTGTPWHKDDAFSMLTAPVKYPASTTGILPKAKLDDFKDFMGAALYAANYELQHIANESRFFGDPVLKDWPDDLDTVAYLDPAYKGTNHTALTIGGKLGETVYVRGFVWIATVEDLYTDILKELKRARCGTITIEINADQGYTVKEFKKLWPSVKGYRERENKHLRILNYVRKYWKNIVFDSAVNLEYLNEILDYQEGQEPDDAPDALAGLMRTLGYGKGTFKFKAIGADGAI